MEGGASSHTQCLGTPETIRQFSLRGLTGFMGSLSDPCGGEELKDFASEEEFRKGPDDCFIVFVGSFSLLLFLLLLFRNTDIARITKRVLKSQLH